MSSFAVKRDGFEIADFSEIEAVTCPCGPSRRAFVDGDGTMSVHRVDICSEDKPHRHETDEVYIILNCGISARMRLGDDYFPVKAGAVVKIRGGTMHCADQGGYPMSVLVVVATGHGSPEAEMKFS